jgi:CRISPR/Cas system-associated exonuclease Cas4 (RecB family)
MGKKKHTSKFIPYTPDRNWPGMKMVVIMVRKYMTCKRERGLGVMGLAGGGGE